MTRLEDTISTHLQTMSEQDNETRRLMNLADQLQTKLGEAMNRITAYQAFMEELKELVENADSMIHKDELVHLIDMFAGGV